jgi:hypothetical protein
MMTSVVVDVDDTLISTDRRLHRVWREVLGRDVPFEDVETLGLEQIFMKHASPEQKARVTDFQKRFWDIVLCLDSAGVESLPLHDPIPFAAEVLQKWSKHCTIVYLTGRTENTRDITLSELKKFGFPIGNTQLLMFNLGDYARTRGEDASGPTLIDGKSRLLSSISGQHKVLRVVDDFPGYFAIYKQHGIPERIGLLRPKRYSPQQYIDKGATRVVESWRELQEDSPKLT